ncbi:ATP-binding cassette domain-containing protein [Raineyella antarctica]|uniref:ATP-binding cassette domain-containing protein n=1 Tax=Raineyella antarctica TaxID=1577474 RepID=UPI001114C138|nr:ATP-binding cassette domain-containing protein [Raineyella antarctica]
MTNEPCVIRARELQLASSRGPVYGPIDLDVPAGRLIGLVSPEGGGRTSLLLTLAGRMRFTAGTLTVLDRPLPRSTAYVQGHSALANFADIDAPDDGLTPRELFRERAGLLVPLWRRIPGWGDRSVQGPLEQVFADRTPPAPDEQIWRLEALDRTLLAISLALLGRPHLLVVDDIDALHHPADQLVTWRALQRLTSPDLTVVASAAARELVPPEVEAIDPHGPLSVPARSADTPLPPATPIEVL